MNKIFFLVKKIKKDKIHNKEVPSITWSPDDKKIVSTSADHNLKIWNTETGFKLIDN